MRNNSKQTLPQDELQRRSSLLMRTLAILITPFIVVPLILAVIIGIIRPPIPDGVPPDAVANPQAPIIAIVVVVLFFTALIVLVRLGRPTISALLLIGGWTAISSLLLLRGGIGSNATALLIIPIVVAGLLIDEVACIGLAALATLLVWSLAWLEQQGFPPNGVPVQFAQLPPFGSAVFWTLVFWLVAALTFLLTGSLQRALAQSRAQAQELGELSAQLEQRVAAQTVQLEQRASRAEALYDIGRALASTSDLPTVLGKMSDQVARLLHFEAALVLLPDQETSEFAVEGMAHPAVDALALAHAHDSFQAVLAQNTPAILALDHAAALALPLRYAESVEGILLLVDAKGTAERSEEDMHLAAGIADQAAVAIANTQLLEQSREAAVLEERTRLARDIHDTLAQGLTGIVMQLGAAQRALDHAPTEAPNHVELAARMARESLAEARRSVWNLRAPALERGDLADALRGLATHPPRPDMQVSFVTEGETWPLPVPIESALLRVGQEALVNAAKHAHGQHVALQLHYGTDLVRLTVTDDGIGFQSLDTLEHAEPSIAGGFGLLGMRERLQALGGSLELANNGGAIVRATVPRTAKG